MHNLLIGHGGDVGNFKKEIRVPKDDDHVSAASPSICFKVQRFCCGDAKFNLRYRVSRIELDDTIL